MNKNNAAKENIELSLPVNAAYVSAVRLTASSIANRLKFDIDEIEDIKAAVSEACIYIIKKAANSNNASFKINFLLYPDVLDIQFKIDHLEGFNSMDSEMSIVMIKALMDDMDLDTIEGSLCINMTKRHKINNFNGFNI